jgi:hypothetical protein
MNAEDSNSISDLNLLALAIFREKISQELTLDSKYKQKLLELTKDNTFPVELDELWDLGEGSNVDD